MIECRQLFQFFQKYQLDFFTGVPDSTFSPWFHFLEDHQQYLQHLPANNEGGAIAIAAGYQIASGKPGIVYMQNSGLGNCVNPLTSLVDREVYSIPMLLIIGWRGKPGTEDEPQHRKMGRITLPLLELLEIPFGILPRSFDQIPKLFAQANEYMTNNLAPYAIIVEKNTLSSYQRQIVPCKKTLPKREETIAIVMEQLAGNEVIVSTTGKISRELYEYRIAHKQSARDFYTVGSMGCASSIAFGLSSHLQKCPIIVFDGDGAMLMRLEACASIGAGHSHIKHIVFDNESYESTGAQPTISSKIDLGQVALACGYRSTRIVEQKEELAQAVKQLLEQPGPAMLVIKVKKGSRKDLGRPNTTPVQNKNTFIDFLREQ